ncbi:MAG: GNAT family N-acetyltransferase [Nitrospina sp.]|jgi:ribosomal protein S18 acetylase RimI-like enzyme|nr:GNAT family N-acetyltransferase [Nitrospina sp.]MBT5633148.1 GNAT family N-acetyltransferase [Nitrospina sp.]
MELEIKVREAHEGDLAILVLNNQALAIETEDLQLNKVVLKKGIEQALKRKECHYFVATIEGEVAGQTMITYEWSDWRNGIIWWMQSVYVLPDFRKQGVFRELFSHIEIRARGHKEVKALRLYVMQNNNAGKRTYQSMGMNNSGYIVYEKEEFS